MMEAMDESTPVLMDDRIELARDSAELVREATDDSESESEVGSTVVVSTVVWACVPWLVFCLVDGQA